MLAQSPGICVAHVVDPALHTRVEFGKCQCASLISIQIAFEAAGEVHRIKKQLVEWATMGALA